MKITILALLAAGCLAQSVRASDTMGTMDRQLNLAVIQDSHGGSRFVYYQVSNTGNSGQSVALSTSSGGVVTSPMLMQTRALPDNGQTRFVIGTNQHGQANGAFIPVTSHYLPAGQ